MGTAAEETTQISKAVSERGLLGNLNDKCYVLQINGYKLLILGHRKLIKNKTQTAVINIITVMNIVNSVINCNGYFGLACADCQVL